MALRVRHVLQHITAQGALDEGLQSAAQRMNVTIDAAVLRAKAALVPEDSRSPLMPAVRLRSSTRSHSFWRASSRGDFCRSCSKARRLDLSSADLISMALSPSEFMVRLYPRGVATRPVGAWTHQSLQFNRPDALQMLADGCQWRGWCERILSLGEVTFKPSLIPSARMKAGLNGEADGQKTRNLHFYTPNRPLAPWDMREQLSKP